MIRLLSGDCRDVLATLPAESVQCVVTSPPYYALRAYLDATHPDKHREIGLEATPDEYLATMVAVFREVRRVLRRDGTVWCNMGSSYSNGKGSNVTDQLNRLFEGGLVFFTDAGSVAVAGHSVGVSLHHEGAPDGELPGFLAAERNGVEQRDQNLCKVIDLLACPGSVGAGPAVLGVIANTSDPEIALDQGKHGTVVPAKLNTQAEAVLAVLGPSSAGARENDKAAFAIHEADEPCVRGNVRWHTAWHTFAAEAVRKGLEDVHLVDDAIALGNRLNTLSGLLRDFRVTKASEQKITLTSVHGGLSLAISDVGHLWFVLRCGSIVPYSRLYADASRSANALLPKQDIGMPWRLARALQEDGWILRSPIIWHKPNPMPESVTDRPTSSHEHVFLLTRSSRYYYDAAAVAEPADSFGRQHTTGIQPPKVRALQEDGTHGRGGDLSVNYERASRSCRNVWTIATHAYSAAHFATFPPELAERCIKAGTSERGCCAACGKPWVRVTERTFIPQRDTIGGLIRRADGLDPSNGWKDTPRGTVEGITTGWLPGCECHGHFEEREAAPDWISEETGERKRVRVWVADGDAPPPVPCTVLDPFIGAGTTALVADRLQRDCIGIDLTTGYTEMAMERVRADAPLFTSFAPAEDPEESRMADLFAGDEYERSAPSPKPLQVPRGWDTGPGAHGTIHRTGRTLPEAAE